MTPGRRAAALLLVFAVAGCGQAAPAAAPGAAAPSPTVPDVPPDQDGIVGVAQSDTPGRPLVDPLEIRTGGVGLDGIPAIDRPVLVGAAAASRELVETEPVLLVEVAGEARAYPLRVLVRHEIANDVVGGMPLAVTWCPLCNTAVVFDRRVGATTYDFGVSGSLYRSALVMYDRQTRSLWTQPDGRAVLGRLTGATLTQLPADIVSWRDALAGRPGISVVVAEPTELARDTNPYADYDTSDRPFLFPGATDPRLPATERVVGVSFGGVARAWSYDELRRRRVVADAVAGRELVVLFAPSTRSPLDGDRVPAGREIGGGAVFDPVLDGRLLHFGPDGDGRFRDADTGSTWDITGRALTGPLTGRALSRLPHLDAFWFAWAAYNPDTSLVR